MIADRIKVQENTSYNPRIAEMEGIEAQLMECEENGLYQKGLKLAIDSIDRFPENPSLTYSWTAIFHFLLGMNDKSIQVLSEGLTKGAVWSPSFLEESFQGFKDHPQFLQILQQIRENSSHEKAFNQAELLVRTPKNYSTTKKYPLLLVFHGRFDSNAANDIRWRSIIEQNEIFLALLQSSQMQSGNHFVWDDENKAFEDLKLALAILDEQYPIDSSQIILAGVSQGSELALVAIFSGLVAATKFISVIPSFGGFSYQLTNKNSWRNKKEKIRGCFIAGERDPRFSQTQAFFKLLRDKGIDSQLFSYPELGHQIPEDFEHILVKAVDFVLEEKL